MMNIALVNQNKSRSSLFVDDKFRFEQSSDAETLKFLTLPLPASASASASASGASASKRKYALPEALPLLELLPVLLFLLKSGYAIYDIIFNIIIL
jgi:hypothetical protein